MYDFTKSLYYRKPSSPCKGCSDRIVGCHSECKEYCEWVKIEESIMNKIQNAKLDESMKNEVDIKGTKRRKKGFLR